MCRRPTFPQTLRLYLVSLFISRVAAQQNTFFWGFQTINPTLQECGSITVQILPLNPQTAIPAGPFTMFSYQVGGPTVPSPLIGTDPNNLQWTVPHTAGSQILIQVADPSGNSGGIANAVFTVAAGPSNACHPANPSPTFKMATAVTSAKTCDPIELDFTGGTPPYSVTIVAQGSSVVTNDTTGKTDNEYTYINRAPPNLPLLIAAHDVNGQYAFNTNLIPLSGPTDTTCAGKQSGGGVKGGVTSAAPSKASSKTNPKSTSTAPKGTPSSSTSHSNTGAIAGGVAAGAVVLIGVVALGVFFCLRKRNRGDGYRRGSNQFSSYPPPGKVADESFATRPMLAPGSPQPGGNDYGMNQYVFTPNPNDPSMSSVALQYVPNNITPYTDGQSSSGRTDSTAKTPQSFMYAHNLPSGVGSTSPYGYPPEKHPQQFNQQFNQQQQYPPPQQPQSHSYNSPPPPSQQQLYSPYQQQSQQQYTPQNLNAQTQYPPYTPASVAYANSRLSAASSDAQRSSGAPLIPPNTSYGQQPYEEEESELAYRLSTGSAYNNSYAPPVPQQQPQTQQQQYPRSEKGPLPSSSQPQVLQHRDAGPVVEIPPAYGDSRQ